LAALRGESSGNVGIAGGLTGFVQTIQPGVIVEVPMANMPIGPNGSAMRHEKSSQKNFTDN
jgi:hypothetical protein